MKRELILVINPGSTSTKVAIYDGAKEMDTLELKHNAEDLSQFHSINDQLEFRKAAVLEYLSDRNVKPYELSAIACRGGVVGQLESGAYLVDKSFAEASLNSPAPHPANLSPVIGYEIAKEANEKLGVAEDSQGALKAYVYDAVCGCGNPTRVFTITGIPEIEKPFLTHVLNSRAVSIEQARRDGVDLQNTTYIVTHLGGGITTNLIKSGKIVDFVGDDEG
jgi:butyrate kinase